MRTACVAARNKPPASQRAVTPCDDHAFFVVPAASRSGRARNGAGSSAGGASNSGSLAGNGSATGGASTISNASGRGSLSVAVGGSECVDDAANGVGNAQGQARTGGVNS